MRWAPYTLTRAHRLARLLGGGLLVLAALLVTGTLLGPVGFAAIHYPIPGDGALMSQLVALDVFSVAVVAPVAVCAAVLVLRRHPLGGVLALAPSVYTAYMVPQYVLGPQYLHYDDNSEAFFPLLLALFVLGWTTALLAWQQIDPAAWTPPSRRERLTGGILIPLLAIVTFTRYVPAILDAADTHPAATDYQEGPGYFARLKEAGLVRERTTQRTDSTHVLAAVRDLTRLELVTEAVRAALEEVARTAGHLLVDLVDEDWGRRYGRPVRLGKNPTRPKTWINTTGDDAVRLLEHLREHGAGRAFGAGVQALRQIMVQNYYRDEAGRVRWRTADDGGLPPSSSAIVSPYDITARYVRHGHIIS